MIYFHVYFFELIGFGWFKSVTYTRLLMTEFDCHSSRIIIVKLMILCRPNVALVTMPNKDNLVSVDLLCGTANLACIIPDCWSMVRLVHLLLFLANFGNYNSTKLQVDICFLPLRFDEAVNLLALPESLSKNEQS